MRNLSRSWVFRYGLAATAYFTLIGLSTGLRRTWGFSFDTTTLIILTMIASAWYLGRGPGLLVALLFEATLDYYAGFPHSSPRFYVIMFNRIVLFGSVVLFASARRNAEHQLRQAGEQLSETLARERAARAEAESASRLKDDFLATVSHELRTPLNAIIGWATTLNRHTVDEDTRRQAFEVIERNANAQARLVDDILDFSLIQKGRLKIQPQPVALAAVVREAIETVRLSAAAKAITIESSLDVDATVPGDPDRLRQMAWNLLSNAVKFTLRRRANPGAPRGSGHGRGAARGRHRSGDRSRVPAARLRSIPAGRPVDDAAARRPRSRPRHRPAPGGTARRHDLRHQCRHRPGRHVHRQAAGRETRAPQGHVRCVCYVDLTVAQVAQDAPDFYRCSNEPTA